MPLKNGELNGIPGRNYLRITGQQKSVEAMSRLRHIRSLKVPHGKVIHTSLTELTAFDFWAGELVLGLLEVRGSGPLRERGDLGESGF